MPDPEILPDDFPEDDEDDDVSALLSGEFDDIFLGQDRQPPAQDTAPALAFDANKFAQDILDKVTSAIAKMAPPNVTVAPTVNPPAVNVTVEPPKRRAEKTVVLAHDESGRIKEFIRYEVDDPNTN